MEHIILVLVFLLALGIIINRVRNLIKNPSCDGCTGNCSSCGQQITDFQHSESEEGN